MDLLIGSIAIGCTLLGAVLGHWASRPALDDIATQNVKLHREIERLAVENALMKRNIAPLDRDGDGRIGGSRAKARPF